MNTLYWFTRDLRLHDNATLLAASKSDMLLCVYVVDPRWFQPGSLQSKAMGGHRWRFLWQSLIALERNLRHLGQRLHIAFGEPEKVLPELVHGHRMARVVRSRQPGTREAGQWQTIQDKLPGTIFQEFETLSLYTQGALPMGLEDLPDTFSQFRKLIEKTGERGCGIFSSSSTASTNTSKHKTPSMHSMNGMPPQSFRPGWPMVHSLHGKLQPPFRNMNALKPETSPPTGCGLNCCGGNIFTGTP